MSSDKPTIQELLNQLGFSVSESEIYWSLLNLETVSIRKVAAFSGINRGTVYEALKRLTTAGLANVRRSGQREYYSAASPEKVYDLIREKRKDLWQLQQQAQQVVPEILAKKAKPQGRPLVSYHQDDEGIVTVLRDVLATCSKLRKPEYYVYSSKPLRQYLYRKFPQFTDRRTKENIAVKVIAVGEGGDPAAISERKWLVEPKEGSISSYTIIYGDKVANISISSDYTPYAVVTEDAGAAAMQRLLFERLWQSL